MHRRRFLSIFAASACAVALPRPGRALTRWRGVALGAEASITLEHPQADQIIAHARAEIARLEAIFSLHDPNSALVRLNTAGQLAAPPFELLDCLALAGRVHATTGGAFDPTIQPLWALYAAHAAQGGRDLPPVGDRIRALALIGWSRVRLAPDEIRMTPGTAISLNGIAQGYIADRVAALLRGMGLTDVLVNTGEIHAVGGDPRGGPWRVGLADGPQALRDPVALEDGALATSAPLGTVFDAEGRIGHILDPQTGLPAAPRWRLVSVNARQAALADALSTAFVLMPRDRIETALEAHPSARIARMLAA